MARRTQDRRIAWPQRRVPPDSGPRSWNWCYRWRHQRKEHPPTFNFSLRGCDGDHDALTQLAHAAAGGQRLLPERAGQPVKAWAHISLADLLLLDGNSALQEEWTARVRARWAARRAHASETGASDGAWLDGDAAEAIACDAAMAPIVTGDVNVDALETSDAVKLSSCWGIFCCQARGRWWRRGRRWPRRSAGR